jgi:D-glycero-D-manno-heptose 1,7-bisphosphate phosphatase
MSRRAVFLDRDGVVNRVVWRDGKPVAPLRPDELVIDEDVPRQISRLHTAGWETVVVSNQPDVARGALSEAELAVINGEVTARTGVDHVYTCPHDGAADCSCRKPRPGLLLTAAAELDLSLADAWLVGDRWVDIAAAAAAGVRSILLANDYAWEPTSSGPPPVDLTPTRTVAALADAVQVILTS